MSTTSPCSSCAAVTPGSSVSLCRPSLTSATLAAGTWIVATTLSGIVTSSENVPGPARSHEIGMRPRCVTTTPDALIGVSAGVEMSTADAPGAAVRTPRMSFWSVKSTVEPNPCDSLSPVWRASQLSHV